MNKFRDEVNLLELFKIKPEFIHELDRLCN